MGDGPFFYSYFHFHQNESIRPHSFSVSYNEMGGQTAFAYYDNDTRLLSYWFMRDMNPLEFAGYLNEPINVIRDVARPLIKGNCLLEEFKSEAFQEEHDLVWAAIIMPDCIVCYNGNYVITMKKRTK